MNLILGFFLSFVIVSSIGVAYSQTEPIPTWIKGVAGFWVEDRITNAEFIEALEFLIESGIIKVYDPRVEQLEKKNMDLIQKIELLESEEIQPETTDVMPPPEKDKLMYITTDRQEYGLGDTIQVSGFVDRSVLDKQFVDQRLGKTITRYDKSLLDIYVSSHEGNHVISVSCERASFFVNDGNFIHNYNETQKEYVLVNFEMDEFYPSTILGILSNGYPNNIQRCFDDEGNFEFNFIIDENYYEGKYKVYISDRELFSSPIQTITIK